jgi:hypothetical protein
LVLTGLAFCHSVNLSCSIFGSLLLRGFSVTFHLCVASFLFLSCFLQFLITFYSVSFLAQDIHSKKLLISKEEKRIYNFYRFFLPKKIKVIHLLLNLTNTHYHLFVSDTARRKSNLCVKFHSFFVLFDWIISFNDSF